jgi:hypothetical protein
MFPMTEELSRSSMEFWMDALVKKVELGIVLQ